MRGVKGTDQRYYAVGRVRGSCGHKHVTVRAAVRCMLRDQRGCRMQGGYSDRSIARLDGNELTEAEQEDASNAVDAFLAGEWSL